MTRTSIALLALLPLVACRTSEPAPPPPGISGMLTTDVFHVPAGETVWVDADLSISAGTAIVIDGRLVARDAAALGLQDAPHIELVCGLAIDVTGEVLGGRGADAQHTRGGNGSNVVITAPYTRILGQIVAGSGGEGGRSMPGGRGGDALVNGVYEGDGEPGHFGLRSGAGGRGGYPGGDGGPGGAAIARVPEGQEVTYELRERALATLARVRGQFPR